jgi:glycosyltransferase domain-containing protein
MRNLTLVIPTYNRPHLLATFVGYLQAERAECQIVIADSRPEVRNANRALVQRVKLDLNYAEFPVETHPFDKFREAVYIAKTSFCALCADDDLIVLDGVRHCLDALRSNPQAAVAQGYSFSFLCAPDGGMDPAAFSISRRRSMNHATGARPSCSIVIRPRPAFIARRCSSASSTPCAR